MFGRKKKTLLEKYHKSMERLEQCEEVVNELLKRKHCSQDAGFLGTLDAASMKAEIPKVFEQMHTDMKREESISDVENELLRNLKDCYLSFMEQEKKKKSIMTDLQMQQHEWLNLLDHNKHFTSPAKYVKEMPSYFTRLSREYSEKTQAMVTFGRQMSDSIMQAAVEASKLGEDSGKIKQLTEESRSLAALFVGAAAGLDEEMRDASLQIRQMEQQVGYLVRLLKENNISMGRIIKNNESYLQQIENLSCENLLAQMEEIKEQMKLLRNLQTEQLKKDERQRILLSDIWEELQDSLNQAQEIEKNMDCIVDMAEEYASQY